MAQMISIEALKNRLADEVEGLDEVAGDPKDELIQQGRVEMLDDLINFLETLEDDEE